MNNGLLDIYFNYDLVYCLIVIKKKKIYYGLWINIVKVIDIMVKFLVSWL